MACSATEFLGTHAQRSHCQLRGRRPGQRSQASVNNVKNNLQVLRNARPGDVKIAFETYSSFDHDVRDKEMHFR